MSKLWNDVVNNLGFVAVCLAVIAVLGVIARLMERRLPQLRKVSPARRVSIIGICAALAAVLYMLDFPLLFLAPSFYKLDFSEVPVLLAGFFLGPSAAVACEGIKVLLKLLLKGTSTAFVGDFANFFTGCCFVLPATVCYHIRRTRRSALTGLILGTLCMAVVGTAFNAVYLLPKFAELFHMPLDAIIGMGAEIHPSISGVGSFVFLCVAPLNIVKGAVVSLLTMLLYKHVARPLFQGTNHTSSGNTPA